MSFLKSFSTLLTLSQRSNVCLSYSLTKSSFRSIQRRRITNATKVDYIPSLLAHSDITRIPAKPGGWHPSLIHSSGELKFSVITVPVGGEVPVHHHSSVWDYFIPLSGKGVIELRDGEEKKEMYEQGFLAVPPGESHRVRNAASEPGSDEFVFLLAQSPRHKYDWVDGSRSE